MQRTRAEGLLATSGTLTQSALAGREAQDAALRRFGDALVEQLRVLSEANERRLSEVRVTVEERLTALAADNEKKLEQMRQTVDEKLHATLEQRLGESFKQVAERLEQVHKGLGEMQNLARDVGSLNRVLTNVKSRGIFGEVQLAGLPSRCSRPSSTPRTSRRCPAAAHGWSSRSTCPASAGGRACSSGWGVLARPAARRRG